MDNSRIKLIFLNFSALSLFLPRLVKKMAHKNSQNAFSYIFMKISIYGIFSNKQPGRLCKYSNFLGGVFSRAAFHQAGHLFKNSKYD